MALIKKGSYHIDLSKTDYIKAISTHQIGVYIQYMSQDEGPKIKLKKDVGCQNLPRIVEELKTQQVKTIDIWFYSQDSSSMAYLLPKMLNCSRPQLIESPNINEAIGEIYTMEESYNNRWRYLDDDENILYHKDHLENFSREEVLSLLYYLRDSIAGALELQELKTFLLQYGDFCFAITYGPDTILQEMGYAYFDIDNGFSFTPGTPGGDDNLRQTIINSLQVQFKDWKSNNYSAHLFSEEQAIKFQSTQSLQEGLAKLGVFSQQNNQEPSENSTEKRINSRMLLE